MSGDVLEELDKQGAEITRLRNDNAKLRGIIRIQDAAIRSDAATLTDAEREALRGVLNDPDLVLGDCRKPLEDLLARSTTSTRE